jgi:type IV pilus assembly protein PilO
MASFGEMSGIKQWGAVVLGVALITGALHYTIFRKQQEQNAAAQQQLQDKLRENADLEAYKPKLADMERQLANLKQQLDIEQRIVPYDKNVDAFMRMLDGEAQKAGIEIRRYTAQPARSKDFYTEIPFELELDGPYYSVLSFYDRVGKLERIVNVSNLLVASVRKPSDAKAKHTYQYASNESVVATCVATTFFSHDLTPASGAAAGAAAVKPVAAKQ